MTVAVGEECFPGRRKPILLCTCACRERRSDLMVGSKILFKCCSCEWMKAHRSSGNHAQGWEGLVGQVKRKWEKMKKHSCVCVCVRVEGACCDCAWRATDCLCMQPCARSSQTCSAYILTHCSSFFRGDKYGYILVRSYKHRTGCEMQDLLILGN